MGICTSSTSMAAASALVPATALSSMGAAPELTLLVSRAPAGKKQSPPPPRAPRPTKPAAERSVPGEAAAPELPAARGAAGPGATSPSDWALEELEHMPSGLAVSASTPSATVSGLGSAGPPPHTPEAARAGTALADGPAEVPRAVPIKEQGALFAGAEQAQGTATARQAADAVAEPAPEALWEAAGAAGKDEGRPEEVLDKPGSDGGCGSPAPTVEEVAASATPERTPAGLLAGCCSSSAL